MPTESDPMSDPKSDPMSDPQNPRRRLTGKVQAAFDMACGQRDLPVAELLYGCLELLSSHYPDEDPAARQADLDALVEAQNRLIGLKSE